MAHIIADRVLETSTTTGTGALTLAGAITGYRAFSAVCATNDTVDYAIFAVDSNGVPTGEWEVGVGTYSAASTLTRTTVKASSNAGSAVNFSAGTKRAGISVIAATLPGKGAAFPGSPATGDKFYRTDRNIEYFYDGTRWLSTQLHSLSMVSRDVAYPQTAIGTIRSTNPFGGLYDVYVEQFNVTSYVLTTPTSANYFTGQLRSRDGSTDVNLGSSISMQNDADNTFVMHSLAINTVVSSTVDIFEASFTETGTASSYLDASITFRLVG